MNHCAELGVPAESPTIEVDGIPLAVARAGRGPAVVCLHAIGHGGRDFEAFAARVNGFEVIRVDWPGHGRSGPDRMPPSAARYAMLLDALIDRLGIAAPIIIGCSIGGAAALSYAAARPVRALVLCDPGGLVAVTPVVARFCRGFARFFAAGERRAWWYRWAFRAYYGLVLPEPSAAAQRRRITDACYETAPLLRQAWEGFGRPEADLRAVAASLEIPIWFAWARRDRIVRLRDAAPTIDGMQRVHVTLFDAGHAAFLEQPEAFAVAFDEFVSTLPPVTTAPLSAQHCLNA